MSTTDVSLEKRATGAGFSTQTLVGPATLLLIIVLLLLGIYPLSAPQPLPSSAPATEFSAVRARAYVESFAQSPHPIGTVENVQARTYLLEQLKGLGLDPQVQESTPLYSEQFQNSTVWGLDTVYNVVGRMGGSAPSKAVLLVAHYDLVSVGPGASDGGASVAALIEVLRALKAGPQLQNDVIVLFTDGEELDLLGARAFIDFHPWAKDVGVVFHFVARGTSGPSVMFETGQENGWLIQEFAKSAPHPVATSLSDAVYQILPNDTDFTPFKDAGYAGLNFAYFDRLTQYHTRLDNLENLDERSLQHHGDYALALTRHFGNLDLTQVKRSSAVYFDLFGLTLIHYPLEWVLPLTILMALIFLGVVVFGRRKKQLSLLGIALGALAFVVSVVLPFGVVTLLWGAIRQVHPGYEAFTFGTSYNSSLYMVGFIATTIAIVAALYVGFRKKLSIPNLTIGALFVWLLLLIASTFYLPSASYIFTWPLFFSLLAFAGTLALSDQGALSGKRFVVLSLGAIPGIILFVPTIYLIYLALNLGRSNIVMGMVALLLGTLIPQLYFMALPSRWFLPGALAVVGAGCIVAGSLTAGFDSEHPKPDSIFYAMDANTGKATWVSTDIAPDDWTAQFFSAGFTKDKMLKFMPFNNRDLLTAPAPVAALDAPEVLVDTNRVSAGEQTLHLRIRSPRQASWLLTYIEINSATSFKASLKGKQVAVNPDHGLLVLGLFDPTGKGVDLELTLERPQPVKVTVVDASQGLANTPGITIQPRPASAMPTPYFYWNQDKLFVAKTFEILPASN